MARIKHLAAIWKERYLRCFEGRSSDVSILVERVKHSVATWVSFSPLFKGISINSIIHNWEEVDFSHPIQNRVLPRWCPPPPSALKLNFDGSARGNTNPAGLGGVV
eukprot:TRINITY_DN14373_c0_g2_i2.p1 TRINITY_DN14373_c0_g2~~TRINITY_DN14373_c0_g2_i2.p1  ORF type:complete len:106 (-),score=11.39 TRINITY_DN14373_c0_g2_i2:114-431(-)